MINFPSVKSITDSSGVSVAKILDSAGKILWSKVTIPTEGVFTSAYSGVTYKNGISDLSAAQVNTVAKMISNTSDVTNVTQDIWVHTTDSTIGNRKISVGDQVTLALGDGYSYAFDVIGFNHDALTTATAYGSSTATGKAGFTFQMHETVRNKTYQLDNVTSGYYTALWSMSTMRSSTMPTMYSYLPTAWKNCVKTVDKYSVRNKTSVTTTSEQCFILAFIEIYTVDMWPSSYTDALTTSVELEGSRYAYYAAGNSAAKMAYYGGESAIDLWWLRTAGYVDSSRVRCMYVNASGSPAVWLDCGDERFVSFAFCI